MQIKNKLNKQKMLKKLWNDLFKAILVKKQLSETYD